MKENQDETYQLNGSEKDEHLNTKLVDQFSDDFASENRNSPREEGPYTEKNVLEFELPELIICYKDTYYDMVKDICVDEVMLEKEKNLIKCCKDEKSCVDRIHHNSVESRSVASSFDDPENVKEQPVESVDLHDQKDTNIIGIVHEQSNDNSTNTRSEIVDKESLGNDNGDSDKSRSCIIDDGQVVETHNINREDNNSGDLTNVDRIQYDFGESSFSAAGHVTFSGPIAYSGSLSIRSEASATSARSFAFPILQTEWDTSPVRMARADRRQLSKTKGWRSGILCCRF